MKRKLLWLMLIIMGFVVAIQGYFFNSYIEQYKNIEFNQMKKETLKAMYLKKDFIDKAKLTFLTNDKSSFYLFDSTDSDTFERLKDFRLTRNILEKKFGDSRFCLFSSSVNPFSYILVKKLDNIHYKAKKLIFNESKKRYFRDFIQYGISFVMIDDTSFYKKGEIFFDGKKEDFFYSKDKNFIDVYLLICCNRYIKVSIDRQFYKVVRKNMIMDSALSTLMILVIFMIFYYIINTFVLSKIWYISDRVKMIKQKNSPTLRIALDGQDEFSEMTTWIDNMLKSLEDSRSKELKEKDREIEVERKFLQQIIDSWNHSLLVIDNNDILKTNRSFQNLFGHIFSLSKEKRDNFLKILLTAKSDETVDLKCDKTKIRHFFKVDKCQLSSKNRQLITITDISTFGEELQNLEHSVITDQLTGLYNRKGLYKNLDKHYSNRSYGLLLFDLDFFKKVNDTYGHHTGDRVLVSFAKLLLEETRTDDIKCRVGGEEFVFVLGCTTVSTLKSMAETIRQKTEKLEIFAEDRRKIEITVSIGGVMCDNIVNFEEFFKRADENLYKAKENGRNRSEVSNF